MQSTKGLGILIHDKEDTLKKNTKTMYTSQILIARYALSLAFIL